jgi:thiol-disulfide isomerase/thioredoxin
LTGRGTAEVEAALGKPSGKLQTAQGNLWLYPEWRVQFDKHGLVLKVEKDQPVRLAKVDPQFASRADAVAKAAAERSAADDAARIRRAAARVEDVRIISNGGQPVDLPALLPEGKIAIVDFYADWCGPCRQISPYLERIAKDDPDVVLIKVDIVKWNTPVTGQFGIDSVPNMRVFNRSKGQIGNPTHDLNVVMANVRKAKGS